MEKLKTLLKGFLAGGAISLGGIFYLALGKNFNNKILGTIFFSIGLILICNFDFYLYTGKICYLFDKNDETYKTKISNLSLGLLGNLLGTLTFGLLLRVSYLNRNEALLEHLDNIVTNKINISWYQMLILSIFCGMLVYFAVEGFKKINNPLGKYLVLIMCIAGFILAGFEHCIANMFYFFMNLTFSLKSFLSILICIIGNSLGGIIIRLLHNLIKPQVLLENKN